VEWDNSLLTKPNKMKISKTLLQAILVGVTIGTTTTSCSMLDSIIGDDTEVMMCGNDFLPRGTANGADDCPGCGMG